MKVKKLHPDAIIPTRAKAGDAGYDFYALKDYDVYPGGTTVVDTGIALEIPPGWVGLACPRSGLAVKHQLTILNSPGIIDSGYRGECKAIVINHSYNDDLYHIKKGDRIMQVVFVQHGDFELEETEALNESDRGTGGLGSSGK